MSDLTSFHDVLFPAVVSFGATGGPERRNEIIALTSGRKKRNARFSQSRHRYDAGTGVKSLDDLHDVIAFFEARRGSLHAFRFRDPFDHQSCPPGRTPSPFDQAIGTGDGSAGRYRLVKAYGEGDDAYLRLIARPVASTLRVAVGGAEAPPGTFAFDDATGEVVFAAGSVPGEGLAVTCGDQFDGPGRFDTARLEISLKAFKAGQIPSIPLIEVLS